MTRTGAVMTVGVVLAAVTGCTAASHRQPAAAPTAHPVAATTPAKATMPSEAALKTVVVTPDDVAPPPGTTPVAHVRPSAVSPADDARVRTLVTWCTHTSATEDAAATGYGPRLTVAGAHGPNTVYSYARVLPDGGGPEAAAYTARLARCWQRVLLPVMAATLDPYIEHLTVTATARPLPLPAPGYGSAQAVEGVIRWHPTPARTETSVFDVAVVFGAYTQVTVLAAGADGFTTGVQHLSSDVAAVSARLRAAEHPQSGGQG